MDIRLIISCIFVGQKITDTIPINAKYTQLIAIDISEIYLTEYISVLCVRVKNERRVRIT